MPKPTRESYLLQASMELDECATELGAGVVDIERAVKRLARATEHLREAIRLCEEKQS